VEYKHAHCGINVTRKFGKSIRSANRAPASGADETFAPRDILMRTSNPKRH